MNLKICIALSCFLGMGSVIAHEIQTPNMEVKDAAVSDTPRFAIYRAELPSGIRKTSVTVSDVKLKGKPVLTDKDIESYRVRDHALVLTEEGVAKVPSAREVGVYGQSFVMIADGERCYLGAFWINISSVDHHNPVIEVRADEEGRTLKIERAYPTPDFGRGEDPRPDPRIFKVFRELNKLDED